ncbi:unnamed protein product [Amoebophrya sp. A120]|nr:unnamed protein product [Amoebophrya sp. A120]|eukprot:GSA120T00010263001.1
MNFDFAPSGGGAASSSSRPGNNTYYSNDRPQGLPAPQFPESTGVAFLDRRIREEEMQKQKNFTIDDVFAPMEGLLAELDTEDQLAGSAPPQNGASPVFSPSQESGKKSDKKKQQKKSVFDQFREAQRKNEERRQQAENDLFGGSFGETKTDEQDENKKSAARTGGFFGTNDVYNQEGDIDDDPMDVDEEEKDEEIVSTPLPKNRAPPTWGYNDVPEADRSTWGHGIPEDYKSGRGRASRYGATYEAVGPSFGSFMPRMHRKNPLVKREDQPKPTYEELLDPAFLQSQGYHQQRDEMMKNLGFNNIEQHKKLSRAGIRRLARRGGVRRLATNAYPMIEETFNELMSEILHDLHCLLDLKGKNTVTCKELCFILNRRGANIFGMQR